MYSITTMGLAGTGLSWPGFILLVVYFIIFWKFWRKYVTKRIFTQMNLTNYW